MLITKNDVYWSYAATFLRIGATGILLPFILRMLPSEMVGIWSVFMTITALTSILDFGFNPSFTRNITYIFSGVKTLKKNGYEIVEDGKIAVDYGLLKGVITAMRWFYLRMAILLFLLLITFGSYYIYILLKNYHGNHNEVYVAWVLLSTIITYNLFTLYYDSLLQGKGLIKRSKQIVIIGQIVYLIIATALILTGKGLIAIVSAQVVSVIIVRWLSYRSFFTHDLKENLHNATTRSKMEVLKAIYPNAIKMGLISLGGILVNRSAIIIGSLYLPLNDIASYGITLQLIAIMSALAGIYITTFQPKIAQLRIVQDSQAIKEYYLRGQILIILSYFLGGIVILFAGEWVFKLIGSQTQLLPRMLILIAIIISFLETHHATAASILLSKNEVPFFKASLFAGGLTIVLLFLLFQIDNFGLWAMILAQGIAQGIYQNWKWPVEVIKELEISFKDLTQAFGKLTKVVIKI